MTQLHEPKTFKYKHVKSNITSLINTMEPGCKVPSERDLAKENQCNMQTVRKALSLLVEEGRVERRVGAGTFVTDATHALPAVKHVGILLHSQADNYALRVSSHINEIASEQKLILHTQIISDFAASSLKALEVLQASGCACAIVPWLPWDKTFELGDLIRKSPIPLSVPVAIPGLEKHYFGRPEQYAVGNTRYMQMAGEYFRKLGYEQIAFIGPLVEGNAIVDFKVVGYTQFISKHHLPNHCHLITKDNTRLDELATELAQHAPKLAVICFDDSHAFRFITAMHKLGLEAPQDFAIIGWGNTPLCETSTPPLTSIYGTHERSSIWLLKNAIGQVHGKVIQEPQPTPLQLHVRESCGGKMHRGYQLTNLLQQVGFNPNQTN